MPSAGSFAFASLLALAAFAQPGARSAEDLEALVLRELERTESVDQEHLWERALALAELEALGGGDAPVSLQDVLAACRLTRSRTRRASSSPRRAA